MFFFCISDPYTCLTIRNHKQNCLPGDLKFSIDASSISTLRMKTGCRLCVPFPIAALVFQPNRSTCHVNVNCCLHFVFIYSKGNSVCHGQTNQSIWQPIVQNLCKIISLFLCHKFILVCSTFIPKMVSVGLIVFVSCAKKGCVTDRRQVNLELGVVLLNAQTL